MFIVALLQLIDRRWKSAATMPDGPGNHVVRRRIAFGFPHAIPTFSKALWYSRHDGLKRIAIGFLRNAPEALELK
jgi:hypothetical protein